MKVERTEFIQALAQVLWDYEPLDDTDLWKDVNKALTKANKEEESAKGNGAGGQKR